MTGRVFNIQKFCINDGPGIRTTVFFKGCPLRCKWCHNPESNRISPELLFSSDKCVLCRKCETVCENGAHIFSPLHTIERSLCALCGNCVKICPADAFEIAGKEVTADEVIKAVLTDKEFFEDSGGGLTLSGGEPFMQFDFLAEVLRKAKENSLHTCVETCGFCDEEKLIEASEYIDIFLFDYKLTDNTLHKEYTGVGNEKILSNLLALDKNGSAIILRCPIIPGVNDTDEHFKGIADTANSLCNIMRIEIAPYHELGISKSMRLGEAVKTFSVPEKKEAQRYIDEIKKYTSLQVKRM